MTKRARNAGFTLLETILSLALMALLIVMLSTMTRQWIGNWNAGRSRISDLSAVALAQARLSEDLKAAIPMPDPWQSQSLYRSLDETHIAFLREADPDDENGRLRLIEYRSTPETGIIRRTTIYDARKPMSGAAYDPPVTLLGPGYQLRFAYQYDMQPNRGTGSNADFPTSVTLVFSKENAGPFPPFSVSMPITIVQACALVTTMAQCRNAMRRNETTGPKDTVLPTFSGSSSATGKAAP